VVSGAREQDLLNLNSHGDGLAAAQTQRADAALQFAIAQRVD
jgi:hypothetical protein